MATKVVASTKKTTIGKRMAAAMPSRSAASPAARKARPRAKAVTNDMIPLADLLDLPGKAEEEADLEGMAVADGFLWVGAPMA